MKKVIIFGIISSLGTAYAAPPVNCQKSLAASVQPKQEILLNLNSLKNKVRANQELMLDKPFADSLNMLDRLAKSDNGAKAWQAKSDYGNCQKAAEDELTMNSLILVYLSKLNKYVSDYSSNISDLKSINKCENNSCAKSAVEELNKNISEINLNFSEQVKSKVPNYSQLLPKEITTLTSGVNFVNPSEVCKAESESLVKLKEDKSNLYKQTINNINKQDWLQIKTKINNQLSHFEKLDANKIPQFNPSMDTKDFNQCANKMSYTNEYFKYEISYLNAINKAINDINSNAIKFKQENKCLGNDDCNQTLTKKFNLIVNDTVKPEEDSLKQSMQKYGQ